MNCTNTVVIHRRNSNVVVKTEIFKILFPSVVCYLLLLLLLFYVFIFFLQNPSKLATIFDLFVIAMVGYFVLSIVNSMAQSYHKRLNKDQIKAKTKHNVH